MNWHTLRGSRPWLPALLAAALAGGCGGGGGGTGPTAGENPRPPAGRTWETQELYRVAASGLTSPQVHAAHGGGDTVEVVLFEDLGLSPPRYDLTHLTWDPESQAMLATEVAVPLLDNCSGLGFAVGPDGTPVTAYQGGEARLCGAERQSDAMVSILDGATWQERTAAVGVVARNPVFRDGLAGADTAVAVDAQGRLHVAYQFRYEGCDALNHRYADLGYALLDPAAGANPPAEEIVEGNDYADENRQNRVGEHAAITVDAGGQPAIAYYADLADGSTGLRVARKQGATWTAEWVERGCEVGHVSLGRAPDGSLGIAYYVVAYAGSNDDHHLLRYAAETGDGWELRTVDDAAHCGADCSLTFRDDGRPLIAYREVSDHSGYYPRGNLRLAALDGGVWSRETVASTGDTGRYNSAWVDAQGRVVLVTYSASTQTVSLHRRALDP